MTRILRAYARHRSRWIKSHPKRMMEFSVVQMKIYMMHVRYVANENGMVIKDVTEYFRWKTNNRTTFRYEIDKGLLDRLEDIEKAPAVFNAALCSLQLLASVVGVVGFLEKIRPYVRRLCGPDQQHR